MKIIERSDFAQVVVVIEFDDNDIATKRTDYYYNVKNDALEKKVTDYKAIGKEISHDDFYELTRDIQLRTTKADYKRWNELIIKENI